MPDSLRGPSSRLVLVCGSRDWPHPAKIKEQLRKLPRGSTIIHGGARGADQWAGMQAQVMGFNVKVFPADWRGKGKAAGIIRNLQMLDQGPDLVLAFQKDGSTGTQHTIDEARKRGIPVEVFSLPATPDDVSEADPISQPRVDSTGQNRAASQSSSHDGGGR